MNICGSWTRPPEETSSVNRIVCTERRPHPMPHRGATHHKTLGPVWMTWGTDEPIRYTERTTKW